MRAASMSVTENMASASAAVEENSAAAAREAAASTRLLANGISEIDMTARSLRDHAADLESFVDRFTIDDSGELPPRTSRPLAAGRAVAVH